MVNVVAAPSLRMAIPRNGLWQRWPRDVGERPFTLQLIPYLVRSQADIVMAMNWYWSPAYHTYLARKLKSFMLVGIPLFHTAEAWSNRQIYKRMLVTCHAQVMCKPQLKDQLCPNTSTQICLMVMTGSKR